MMVSRRQIGKRRFNPLLSLTVVLTAVGLLCTLPEDPAQNPENVKLTVLHHMERSDTVTIGDSLTLVVAVQYPHLVDSIKIKVGEFYSTTIWSISDTVSSSLLPGVPGRFAVEITGYCQRDVLTSAAATVLVKSIPVSVTIEPVDDTVVEGGSALFSVAATGNPMPDVQWYLDTVAIGGATGDTLRIDAARVALNGGVYRARFANGFDTLWSRKAVLTVDAAVYRWDAMRWSGAVWR